MRIPTASVICVMRNSYRGSASSVPSMLQSHSSGAFGGFMVSLLIIGIGTGGSKRFEISVP